MLLFIPVFIQPGIATYPLMIDRPVLASLSFLPSQIFFQASILTYRLPAGLYALALPDKGCMDSREERSLGGPPPDRPDPTSE